ncbi:MAG: PD40 domain-containing protein, partial [Phycisphaerales bacterium]
VGASYSPTWSPDGRIYYSCDRGGSEHLWSALPFLPSLNEPTRVTQGGAGPTGVGGGS